MDKGYAVDAVCFGRINRFHYDGDVTIATPHTNQKEELANYIKEILEGTSDFKWDIVYQDNKEWVKFYEKGKKQWGDENSKDSGLAQQLDVHFLPSSEPFTYDNRIIFSPPGRKPYDIAIQNTRILDIRGNFQTFETPIAEELTATKIRLLKPFRELYADLPRESDMFEFQKLFSLPNFDIDRLLTILKTYYRNVYQISDDEAKKRASIEALTVEEVLPVHAREFFQQNLT
jgi:hypothetical protein